MKAAGAAPSNNAKFEKFERMLRLAKEGNVIECKKCGQRDVPYYESSIPALQLERFDFTKVVKPVESEAASGGAAPHGWAPRPPTTTSASSDLTAERGHNNEMSTMIPRDLLNMLNED